MLDLDDIAEAIVEAVKNATAPLIAENAALADRLAVLESREPVRIKSDPAEVDMAAVKELLSDLVRAAFATMPIPKDGESVDPATIKELIDEAVAALPEPAPIEPDETAIQAIVDASVDRAVSALPVPKDGESVDPATIKEMIDEAVAALPTPAPVEPDAEMIERAVDASVERAVAALPTPKDGESVDPATVKEMIDEAVAALPTPAPVEPDAEMIERAVDASVERAVEASVERAVAALPVPKDGESVDPATIKEMIDEAVAALPTPAPVEPDVEMIERAVDASVERAVSALPVAKDGDNGVGLADALIDRDGNLVVTMTDGRTKTLGLVVGKDGKVAPPFTLDDFDIIQGDDERTFKFCFLHGEVMHSFEFELPAIIYRDVWTSRLYQKGDAVTWGGSLWIAKRETDAKPDAPDSGWRLAVKKGRDGKNAQ